MDTQYLFLIGCAFLAGLVDSVSGGGGLIQLPALLVAYPTSPLAILFGTNKFASVFGTGVATIRFCRAQPLPKGPVVLAAFLAFLFAFLGARSVSLLDPSMLRPFVTAVLAIVLVYTLCRPSLGDTHAPKLSGALQNTVAAGIGAILGFYDGFFGPGTGSFMLFAFVALLGFDFVRASASAKVLNVATNIAALAFFIPTGNVRFDLGIVMAVANVLGSLIGVRLALSQGARFVRFLFIFVVVALLLKQGQQLVGW